MKPYILLTIGLLSAGYSFSNNKIFDQADRIKMKVSIGSCLQQYQSAQLIVKIYNSTGRAYRIRPGNIFFNIYTANGSQPKRHQISESISRSLQEFYSLPANDSLEFKLKSPSFADYIFEPDSIYYFEAYYVPDYLKRKKGSGYPVRKQLSASKVYFNVCGNYESIESGNEILQYELLEFAPLDEKATNVPIHFKVKNIGSDIIYVDNPGCWDVSYPVIFSGLQKISPAIKVKPNPDCKNERVKINPFDSAIVRYNYTLDKLIDFSKNAHYSIQFEYNGNIYSEKMVFFQKIEATSNKISISIK